jgi:hypothetical protein
VGSSQALRFQGTDSNTLTALPETWMGLADNWPVPLSRKQAGGDLVKESLVRPPAHDDRVKSPG